MSFDRQMFGLRIREMREAHGMTQFDLALALDVESNFVSRMERGTRTCSLRCWFVLQRRWMSVRIFF